MKKEGKKMNRTSLKGKPHIVFRFNVNTHTHIYIQIYIIQRLKGLALH